MSFVHLHRYAEPKKREEGRSLEIVSATTVSDNGTLYDLRTASKVGKRAGFCFSADGRHLEFRENRLVIVQPDGQCVVADLEHDGRGLHPSHRWIVGRSLVAQDLGNLPLAVVDIETGARRARIEGPTPVRSRPLYLRDDRHIWFVEGPSIRRYDVEELRFVEEIRAPEGLAVVTMQIAASGDIVALVRPEARGFDPSEDAVVRLDRAGREIARARETGLLDVARVGDLVIAVRANPPRLGFLSDDLAIADEITTPSERGWPRVIPFPSPREFLVAGSFGEWDHFGAQDLAPAAAPPKKKGAR